MKNLSFIFSFVVLLLITSAASAQKNDTYFVGQWNILIKGLPNGNTDVLVKFELKDSQLAGSITSIADKKEMPFKTVTLKDSTVTVTFDHSSGQVEMNLLKKDDDHIVGNINNQFDLSGVRKKED
ncbi:hypothetical protein [Pedobacter sp. UYP1]|uniref:hypothetical protein n=1 Tax=Pedobacter sp. UYP1 TaxID=1756396 RepID=UPI003390DCBE